MTSSYIYFIDVVTSWVVNFSFLWALIVSKQAIYLACKLCWSRMSQYLGVGTAVADDQRSIYCVQAIAITEWTYSGVILTVLTL